MDIEYIIVNGEVRLKSKEAKDNLKRKKRSLNSISQKLWKIVSDRLNDCAGDC